MAALEYLVAVVGSRGLIEDRIESHIDILTENGFLIVEQDTVEVTPAQAQLLIGQSPSESSIEAFTSGPCVALLLKRANAYETFNSLRLELDYTYGSLTAWLALRDRAAFFPKEAVLERLFVLIKPSAAGGEAEAGGVTYPEVMALVEEYDFVVLGKEMKILGAEAASAIAVTGTKDEVDYLTSDMSIVLCLEKVGAIQEFQLLIGPNDVEQARQHAPHTLRARLSGGAPAGASYENFLYASESSTQSARDLSIFFPAPFPLERTVAILKPDLLAHHAPHRVLDLIKAQGFTITAQQEVYISKLRAETYLQAQKGESEYEAATKYLSSGPSLVLLLTKPAALQHWNKLLGPVDPVTARQTKPTSLRAQLGTDRVHNALHGSATPEEAKRDIEEFFPNMPLERIPQLTELQDLLSARPSAPARANNQSAERSVYEVLIEGLTQLCRVKPTGDDAVVYLANWLLEHNPYKPAVSAPEDVKPQVTLAEELDSQVSPSSANAPGPLKITWLVGAPGSNKSALAARVTKELVASGESVEHIDVKAMLEQATKTSSEHGAFLAEYLASSRVVPAPLLTSLLTSAIAKATSRNLLLSAFPYSLDQSFDFERVIGESAVKQLVYLEVQPQDATKFAARRFGDARGSDSYGRKLKSFTDDILPVIEQYDLFKKVKKLDIGCEEEEVVFEQLKKLVQPTKK